MIKSFNLLINIKYDTVHEVRSQKHADWRKQFLTFLSISQMEVLSQKLFSSIKGDCARWNT